MAKKTKAKSKKKAAAPKRKNPTKKASNPEDIIELILKDHVPLKKLIKVLKKSELGMDKIQEAFAQFAPLLSAHAKPEEQALYEFMKEDDELRAEAYEGDTEHSLADQLVEECKRTVDNDELFMAKAKVLAELVEHHIEEEEEDLLPDVRKNTDIEQRVQLGQQYIQLKDEFEAEGSDDAPPEDTITEDQQLNA